MKVTILSRALRKEAITDIDDVNSVGRKQVFPN